MKGETRIAHRGVAVPGDSRSERGVVAIVVALALVALLAMILLAVQVGDLGMVRGLLQGSADQAALAGARQLDGTDDGITAAKAEALEMVAGGKNFPSAANKGSDLDISGISTQTGIWDFADPQPVFQPSTDPLVANAVQVVAKKTAEANQEVPMFLGGFLGPETVPVARKSIAALGAANSLPCHPELPLAACADVTPCGQEVLLLTSDSNVDNGCWTGFGSVASGSVVGNFITNCKSIPDVESGDDITLNNGNITGQGYQNVRDALEKYQADTGQTVDEQPQGDWRAQCTGTGNVRVPDLDDPACDNACGTRLDTTPIDVDGDGVVTTADCGMPKIIPTIPAALCNSNCGPGTGKVKGFSLYVITQVKAAGNPKFVKGRLVCGVQIPGAPTGPGPFCSPTEPIACATEPILVNMDVM